MTPGIKVPDKESCLRGLRVFLVFFCGDPKRKHEESKHEVNSDANRAGGDGLGPGREQRVAHRALRHNACSR